MKRIERVLIYGGGLMGKGIAHIFSGDPKLDVTVYDIADNGFFEGLLATFQELVAAGRISREEALSRARRVRFTTDFSCPAITKADLVIENVYENMALKQDTFALLETVCRENAVFCTDTSVMSPTEIAAKLKYKERLVGTHFWNPAYLIPLVEVVKSRFTSDETAHTVLEFLTAAGKKAVLCKKDVPGFIANRMQHALWREALYIVEQGIADAATVDEAVKASFGLRLGQLGPLENADMIGLDLAWNAHDYLLEHLCDSHRPSPLLESLKAEGKLGFKTGEGLQSWTPERIAQAKRDLNAYLIRHLP
ncbi:MAG: 3-hydroxyacyl-CoA dehydrogenase NAD-binding domain-containing protein [Clostridiaceae bacterium]|nr:3-hydroxyacyl-CoA dehydrogenase family protein [Eubacteriales bacterium]